MSTIIDTMQEKMINDPVEIKGLFSKIVSNYLVNSFNTN